MNRKSLYRGLIGIVVLTVGMTSSTTGPSSAVATAKDPVVIIGGMLGSGVLAQPAYVPIQSRLAAKGYQVQIFTTPDYGLGDVRNNAALLKSYIDDLKATSGAHKVDLVTHSQGGLIARAYVKYFGGSSSVDSLIMMGTPNHGTTLASLADHYLGCFGDVPGCVQHNPGGTFLTELNDGDDSIGDVHYTAIATKYEEVVLPYTSIHLDAADGNITNVTVQDYCRYRFVEHGSYVLDGAVFSGVLTALAHEPFSMKCWAL